jgi:hypothetical protein
MKYNWEENKKKYHIVETVEKSTYIYMTSYFTGLAQELL